MKKKFKYLIFTILISLFNQALANDGYVEITPAQPTHSGDKIEVLEVFWYGCPHCYDFEPFINDWLEKKHEDVVFRRMPGIFEAREDQ